MGRAAGRWAALCLALVCQHGAASSADRAQIQPDRPQPALTTTPRTDSTKRDSTNRDRTGGWLTEEVRQDQSQHASLKARVPLNTWAGGLASWGVAAGMVLLAGVMAVQGRIRADLGLPLAVPRSLAERRVRRMAGLAFLVSCLSGLVMLHGPARLPALMGAQPAALAVVAAIVVHAAAALALMVSAAAVIVMCCWPHSGERAAGPQAAPSEGRWLPLLGGGVCAAAAVCTVAALGLVAPFMLIPFAHGASVVPWLEVLRLWHVGAGAIAFLLALVAMAIGTLLSGRAFPSAAGRTEPETDARRLI